MVQLACGRGAFAASALTLVLACGSSREVTSGSPGVSGVAGSSANGAAGVSGVSGVSSSAGAGVAAPGESSNPGNIGLNPGAAGGSGAPTPVDPGTVVAATPSWERIGPWNFFNETTGNGPSGTCAEAVADPSQPTTLYAGGQNNSATTGVRKSTDGGKQWTNVVSGLTDHSIRALRLDPSSATTLYAGTPSGVFRSTDGAASWAFERATQPFGEVRRLVSTSVAGTPTLLAATASGLGYRSFAGGAWTRTAPPGGGGVYDLAVASAPAAGSTVLFAALDNGKVFKVTLAPNGATWAATAMAANILSVDPANPNHVIASVFPGSGLGGGDYTIIESTDAGATVRTLNANSRVFYVGFDPRDASGKTIWTGAESGVGRSTDGGKTFSAVQWLVGSKDGYNANNTQIDVQRLLMDFPGAPAFCSDQGLVQYDPASNRLASLSGDIKDGIVVSVAVSRADATAPHVLTTMWDWGPTESWDGGQSWQATSWYGSAYWNGPGGKGAPVTGEGGQVFAVPNAADGKAHVLMHDGAQGIFLSSDGGQSFTPTTLSQTGNIAYDGFDYARDAAGKADGTFYLITSTTVIQRSANYGQTWANWGQPNWPDGTLSAVAVDPKNAARVYVASGACVTSTNDGGATWSACVTPSARRSPIKRLVVRPDDPTRLLALTNAGDLVQSVNAGAAWTALTSPDVTSVLSPGSAGTALLSYSPSGKLAVLVATVTARPVVTSHVLSTSDDGVTWTDITQDIVATRFNSMTWDGGDLYIGTSGESILRWKGLSP